MNPRSREVQERHAEVRRLSLEEGLTAQQIASRVGITRSRVYALLRQEGLPRNVVPNPRTPRERHILAALGAGMTKAQVCRAFSISAKVLREVLSRYTKEITPDEFTTPGI